MSGCIHRKLLIHLFFKEVPKRNNIRLKDAPKRQQHLFKKDA